MSTGDPDVAKWLEGLTLADREELGREGVEAGRELIVLAKKAGRWDPGGNHGAEWKRVFGRRKEWDAFMGHQGRRLVECFFLDPGKVQLDRELRDWLNGCGFYCLRCEVFVALPEQEDCPECGWNWRDDAVVLTGGSDVE